MNPTVLIINQQLKHQLQLQEVLEVRGFRVLTARDGAEALTVVATEQVDVVLAETQSSWMGPDELAQELAKFWPDLPLVFIAAEPVQVPGLLVGLPTTPAQLAEVLHQAVQAPLPIAA